MFGDGNSVDFSINNQYTCICLYWLINKVLVRYELNLISECLSGIKIYSDNIWAWSYHDISIK